MRLKFFKIEIILLQITFGTCSSDRNYKFDFGQMHWFYADIRFWIFLGKPQFISFSVFAFGRKLIFCYVIQNSNFKPIEVIRHFQRQKDKNLQYNRFFNVLKLSPSQIMIVIFLGQCFDNFVTSLFRTNKVRLTKFGLKQVFSKFIWLQLNVLDR